VKINSKILMSALAATISSSGLFIASATVTAPVSLPAPGASTAAVAGIHVAAVVCGNVGCAPVQTKATPRRKLQWLGHG
jgi:hypothetical protein